MQKPIVRYTTLCVTFPILVCVLQSPLIPLRMTPQELCLLSALTDPFFQTNYRPNKPFGNTFICTLAVMLQIHLVFLFLLRNNRDRSCGSDERHMNVLCRRNVSARQCFAYRESRKHFRLFMNSSASALFGPSVENSVVTLILPFTVT